MDYHELEYHEFAEIFPLMEGKEFEELVKDITIYGQHEQITLYNGKILDGRNRYRACLEAKREPVFWTFEGDEDMARAFVISQNVHRRHLTKKARNEIIKKEVLANPSVTNTNLAEKLHLARNTVSRTRAEMERRAEIPAIKRSPARPIPTSIAQFAQPRSDSTGPVDPVAELMRRPETANLRVPPGWKPPDTHFPRIVGTRCEELIGMIYMMLRGKSASMLEEVYEAVGTSDIERETVEFRRVMVGLDGVIIRAQEWKEKLTSRKTAELRRIK